MLADLTEAEDAVQETLLRIAKRWYRVRKMEDPLAYARRILVNVVLDGARRRSRRHDELSEWAQGHGPDERRDDSAEQAMRAVDARLDFVAALGTLAPRQRAVVVLRYWVDLPEVEVAATLGCSVGTIKSTASRSLARLREMMSDPLNDSLGDPAGTSDAADGLTSPVGLVGQPLLPPTGRSEP
jgi:RNA polymerase sigma-70 factor (sigma-E family)